MNKLIDSLRIVAATVLAFFPIMGMALINIFILDFTMNTISITLVIVLQLASFALGYEIFKTIIKLGVMDFITKLFATPKLDLLIPTKDAETQLFDAHQFLSLFHSGQLNFQEGVLRIWGDWRGRELGQRTRVETIDYDKSSTQMKMVFKNGNILRVVNPKNIFYSTTYFKIQQADTIQWEWKSKDKAEMNYFFYEKLNNEILTTSSVKWNDLKKHTSLGEAAMIFLY